MKRIVSLLIVSIIIISSFCGCESSSNLFYSYNMSDYVSVGDYLKTVDRKTDDYKDAVRSFYKDAFGNAFAYETTEENIERGDIANINYKGTKDGVAFDGGTSANYDLTIGSGKFIKGFEEGLVGHKAGDTVTLNLTFPTDYTNKDLAGQDVVFVVTINFVTKFRQPSESEAVQYGFKSLADYKKQADEFAIGVCLFYNIVDAAKIKKYPTKEQDLILENLVNEYSVYVTNTYGVDLDTFIQYQGLTYDDFTKLMIEQEIKPYMNTYLVAYYILDSRNEFVTEQEVEEKRKSLDAKYEQTLESLGFDAIEIQHTTALSKVVKLIYPEAKVVN